eukprot:g2464.t1
MASVRSKKRRHGAGAEDDDAGMKAVGASAAAAFVRQKKFKVPDMLCCECGATVPSNSSGMCVQCLRQRVDITKGIPTETVIYHCRGCGKYLGPPWTAAERESSQLLAICLKKIPSLRKKVKLVDADFIWTEPHSKRLKVKVTIQKEVHNVIMQQVLVVTFVVTNQTCDECTKQVSNQQWTACVQVRQKVRHKRTILFLEQLLLKHGAHRNATGIQTVTGTTLGGGLDFFFRERNHARTFISFLEGVVPVRTTKARQLATHDSHSNVYSFKYTFLCEITPICRDDLLVLPSKTASTLGSMSNLVVVTGVSNVVQVLEPQSLKRGDIDRVKFWKNPFRSLCTREYLVEFTVIDVEIVRGERARTATLNSRGKYVLADVTVARTRDLGENDTQFYVSSFLGKYLRAGDTVLGYDLTTAVFNDADAAPMKGRAMPDIVLVKKTFPRWRMKKRTRKWKLKRMETSDGVNNRPSTNQTRDLESFMQDLEENKDMRTRVNLYKNKHYDHTNASNLAKEEGSDDDVEDDFPEIELDELLDELTLADEDENEEGDFGASKSAGAAGVNDDDDI